MKNSSFNFTFREIKSEGFERVVEVSEIKSGLHAIIALHNTKLGPALGGIRAFPYATFDHALNDVLRLARGMTYKAAVAETGTGGGKSVIITDGRAPKSEQLLLAFAEAVNRFEGHYICAEDYGMYLSDLEIIRKGTRFAVGLPHPNSSGDPSPFTSFGGFRGIQTVCKSLWGSDSVRGKKIAIQGLGSVGMKLAQSLFWQGAELIVADIEPTRVQAVVKTYGARPVSVDEILSVECDILAPCALGGILSSEVIGKLRCSAVAGLANNQLLTEQDGELLSERNILYAPDYVINSGGLFNVCAELNEDGYCPANARASVERIYDHLLSIFTLAKERKISTHKVANQIAEDNLRKGIGKRTHKVTFHH